jgi:vanillate O-demethylase monooxygenase subunit
MFVQKRWYAAATTGEIGRTLLSRWICGEPLLFFRNRAGEAKALEDRCPHRKAALSTGKLVGDEVEYGYHGIRFDCTGACTHVPGQTRIPPLLKARAYPVAEKYGWAWVWIGDTARADAALIPDFRWNAMPEYKPVYGYIHMRANYQLITDNLMDLTHETYVHPTSIGMTDIAYTPIDTKLDGDKVTVTRNMEGVEAPPLFRKVRGLTKIDRWQRIHFEPPGNIKIDAGGFPAGTEDAARSLHWWVLNSLTPETETSTHYFWSVAREFEHDDEALSAQLVAGVTKIFHEDRVVIEQQQKLIDTDTSGRPLLSVNCDAGGAAARRIVDRLLKTQRAEAAE